MPHDVIGRSGMRVLKLAEPFQVVRISASEYRLAALYDAIAVTAPEASGPLLDRLMPQLAVGASREALLAGAARSDQAGVRRILRELIERGVLVEEPGAAATGEPRHRSQRQFLANFQPVTGVDMDDITGEASAPDLQAELTKSVVLVIGLGRVGSRLARALACAGVGRILGVDDGAVTDLDLGDSAFDANDVGSPRAEALGRAIARANPAARFESISETSLGGETPALPAGLSMVALAEDAFDPDRHAAVNRACIAAAVPWIGYRNLGVRLELGPTVIPHETACWRCYEARRASNFEGYDNDRSLRLALKATDTGLGALNITLGADFLALEVVKTLTHFTAAATYSAVQSIDLATLTVRQHPLLKIPRCPDCGRAAATPAVNVWRYDEEGEVDAL